MKAYIQGTLKITEHEQFSDENGQTVEFYRNYIKSEDGELLVINSKYSYEEQEGETGVATLEIKERQNGGHKVTLKKFSTGVDIDVPEDTIV